MKLLKFIPLIVMALASCGTSDVKCPNSFVVLSGAKDVNCILAFETLQMRYVLSADYPATEAVEEVKSILRDAEWKILDKDMLNPGVLTPEGWSKYRDASEGPIEIIKHWIGDWTNETGDILRYAFIYRNHVNDPENLNLLEVRIIQIPIDLAVRAGEISSGKLPNNPLQPTAKKSGG